jgi:hypothetical protein
MKRHPLAAAIFLVILIIASGYGLPPRKEPVTDFPEKIGSRDLVTYYDANNLLVFTTNLGSVGMDQSMYFGRYEGFYYPFSGDTSDVRSGVQAKTVLYAAGVILVGKVEGALRTAVSTYEWPEFVPGPMSGGGFLPDQPSFRVYKIEQTSGPGDSDYDNWPIADGAPVDNSGGPLLLGEQTLWSVFNDADTAGHGNYYGGGTLPLGIEVQQTVWGSSEDGESDVLYLKYKFYNKGGNIIDSFYIDFWADPDLGGPNDDLAGCDTVHGLFFCYNWSDYDYSYGSVPPAWGGKVISGPVEYSPGDSAVFDGKIMYDYRNMPLSSFTAYVNGTEPDNPEELFLYSMGWDARSGGPMVDPASGDTIHYYAPGNPMKLQGWIDKNPADKRILVGFGPLTFNPGDSQQVVLKLAAHAERDRLISLVMLKHILDSSIVVDTVIDTITYSACDSASARVAEFGLFSVYFDPIKEKWLTGYDWGGEYFSGSADYSSNFFGSALDVSEQPLSFHAVEVRFSRTIKQKAYRYLRGGELFYDYAGYFEVPFTVWDIDNNRQLNAAFVEHEYSDVYDSTWDPDYLANSGGYEFLFIFNSTYSGDDPLNTPIDYTQYNLLDHADSLDILYFFWPVLMEGKTMDNLADWHRLIFNGQFLDPVGWTDTLHFRTVYVGARTGRSLNIKCYSRTPAELALATSDPAAFEVSTPVLRFVDTLEQRIGITFTPYREGIYDERLYIVDSISGDTLDIVSLAAKTPVGTDVNDNPNIVPADFRLYQNYPNPFNSSTNIRFTLARRLEVNLSIYNILGQRVCTLLDGIRPSGYHTVSWDGRNDSGIPVASGLYFYLIKAGERIEAGKMVLIK